MSRFEMSMDTRRAVRGFFAHVVARLVVDAPFTGLDTRGPPCAGGEHGREQGVLVVLAAGTTGGSGPLRFGIVPWGTWGWPRVGAFVPRGLFPRRPRSRPKKRTGHAVLLRRKGGAEANHAIFPKGPF
ncbi:MAG: hypothetical protein CM15mP18_3730 [Methanobacteriota archaeon]|nr:MAG: hypothetical protein CM15mP18_3730 [Euryarchaeota archaeon]